MARVGLVGGLAAALPLLGSGAAPAADELARGVLIERVSALASPLASAASRSRSSTGASEAAIATAEPQLTHRRFAVSGEYTRREPHWAQRNWVPLPGSGADPAVSLISRSGARHSAIEARWARLGR